jgi:hypothetical protein
VFTVQGFGNKKWSAIWAIRQHPKNAVKKWPCAQSNHTLYRIYIYIWDIHTYMGYLYGIYVETNGIWVLWDVYIYMGFRWVYMGKHKTS